jgi:hypothetical protein
MFCHSAIPEGADMHIEAKIVDYPGFLSIFLSIHEYFDSEVSSENINYNIYYPVLQ